MGALHRCARSYSTKPAALNDFLASQVVTPTIYVHETSDAPVVHVSSSSASGNFVFTATGTAGTIHHSSKSCGIGGSAFCYPLAFPSYASSNALLELQTPTPGPSPLLGSGRRRALQADPPDLPKGEPHRGRGGGWEKPSMHSRTARPARAFSRP